MQAVDHKCPNCNANLKYDPKTKGWKCEYCGGKFRLSDLKNNQKKFDANRTKENTQREELDEYYCKDCGAKIVADKNTSATFCVYCKNTAILKSRLQGEFTPSKLIPFTKTKEDAVKAFMGVCKGKILMPKEFSNPKNIQELTGVYIPFWLYSCDIDCELKGKGTRVSTWVANNYAYTKTDTYLVERNGVFHFENIPVDGSVRFNDAIMNSIEPFDYAELIDFNPSYLSGFLSEKYDVDSGEAKKVSVDRAKQTSFGELNRDISYATFLPNSKEGTVESDDIRYVLLPVWMVNIKYHEKVYTFAMNGQTGKMVGDIPYSKKKAVFLFLGVFLVTFVTIALLTYWF